MKTKIVTIGHKQILEQFHAGLTERDIELITVLTSKGYWVYLECLEDDISNNHVYDWHVYNHSDGIGQLMAGTNYLQFKQNNYEADTN